MPKNIVYTQMARKNFWAGGSEGTNCISYNLGHFFPVTNSLSVGAWYAIPFKTSVCTVRSSGGSKPSKLIQLVTFPVSGSIIAILSVCHTLAYICPLFGWLADLYSFYFSILLSGILLLLITTVLQVYMRKHKEDL